MITKVDNSVCCFVAYTTNIISCSILLSVFDSTREMGNAVMRQTFFGGSWWTRNRCPDAGDIAVQDETIAQPLEERPERRAIAGNVISSGGDDGLGTSVVDRGLDEAVGRQLVGTYLTDWYNSPQNVWRHYTEDAVCNLDFEGKRYVATGQTEIRKLFDDVAAPETGTDEDDDGGDCRSLVVQSIVTVRCPSGQLLIVATTEWFTQTFVVEYTAPDPAVAGTACVAVICTSAMSVKRVGVQAPAGTPSIRKRRRRRCRRGREAESQNAADAEVASTATEGGGDDRRRDLKSVIINLIYMISVVFFSGNILWSFIEPV